jgi:hypothetical protein
LKRKQADLDVTMQQLHDKDMLTQQLLHNFVPSSSTTERAPGKSILASALPSPRSASPFRIPLASPRSHYWNVELGDDRRSSSSSLPSHVSFVAESPRAAVAGARQIAEDAAMNQTTLSHSFFSRANTPEPCTPLPSSFFVTPSSSRPITPRETPQATQRGGHGDDGVSDSSSNDSDIPLFAFQGTLC